jgi:PTS system mannose-specific IIB component/fructoselysine and glucoselysine-specific PTS system IIB component
MPVLLCRVDDRLIHGQVVLGWGRPLGLERIVLVDDQVAANEWEQQLYRMAVPAGIEVVFATVAAAIAALDDWDAATPRTAILTGDIDSMAALHGAHPGTVHRINLGGLHHQPGRSERLPYLYLTDAELDSLRRLARGGAQVSAQDVPTAQAVSLESIA